MLVELAAGQLELAGHLDLGLDQGAAAQHGVQEVGRLLQGRRRQARRPAHKPVLHRPVVEDDHRQGLVRPQGDELDMLDPGVTGGRDHHAGASGKAGEQGGGLVQRLLQASRAAGEATLDLAPLLLGDVAELQQAVDEQAQPRMGGQPPGRGVGRRQQAQLRQVLHGVADRCGRQLHAALGNGARAHGLAGLQIGFHHPAEDVAGAGVQLDQAWSRRSRKTGRRQIDHISDGPQWSLVAI